MSYSQNEIEAFLSANGRNTSVMSDSAWLRDLKFSH